MPIFKVKAIAKNKYTQMAQDFSHEIAYVFPQILKNTGGVMKNT